MDVRLDLMWTLDYRGTGAFSVRYLPIFDGLSPDVSESLDKTTREAPIPDDIRGEAEMLRGLAVQATSQPPPLVEGKEWLIEAHTLERFIDERWGDCTVEDWLVFDFVFRHPLAMEKRRIDRWQRDQSSPEFRSLIERIDHYTRARAQLLWSHHYNEFADREQVATRIPPPADVFLGYRAGRADVKNVVRSVYENLAGPPGSSLFRPFMDDPDLRSGDWKSQLETRIRSADVFVVFLSRDFEDGETAMWELELALAARKETRSPEIIPVLLEGAWKEHPSVSDIQGLVLPLEADDPHFLEDQMGRIRTYAVDAVLRRANAVGAS